MRLEKVNRLSKQQMLEVKELVNTCLKTDGLKRELYLNNDINLYENMDSFYLLYDGEELVSVLTILQLNEKEVEISSYSTPEKRNKGYFKTLLSHAENELINFDIYHVQFVVEPNSKHGKMAAMSNGASYIKSEYLLRLNLLEYARSYNTIQESPISIETLKPMDLMQAAYIHSEIFETEHEESEDMMKHILESAYMECFCAKLDDKIIGICNVNYNEDRAFIFGYGIVPWAQGNGYGKAFLQYVLEQLIESGVKKVSLQVNSNSKKAMKIYECLGFKIITQYDYYAYEIEVEESEY